MKKLIALFFIIAYSITFWGCSASAPPNPMPVSKEVTCMEGISGKNYKYLAWGIGDDNEMAEKDALKSALYAAIVGGGAGNCVPLMSSQERLRNSEWVKNFFTNDEEWKKYVRSSNQGRIDADKRLKLESGQVKLGVEAIVDTKMLREDLEAAGVIGGMRIK